MAPRDVSQDASGSQDVPEKGFATLATLRYGDKHLLSYMNNSILNDSNRVGVKPFIEKVGTFLSSIKH